jgi:hypothetical protein
MAFVRFTKQVRSAAPRRRQPTEAFLTSGAKHERPSTADSGLLIAKGRVGIYSCGGEVTVSERAFAAAGD